MNIARWKQALHEIVGERMRRIFSVAFDDKVQRAKLKENLDKLALQEEEIKKDLEK